MTDREILEFAAKAAGIEVEWNDKGNAWKNWPSFKWSLLTDDSDALRLAVIRHLKSSALSSGTCVKAGKFSQIVRLVGLDEASDIFAATCLAIARGAAQIQIDKETK
jgi:hypothetical protein